MKTETAIVNRIGYLEGTISSMKAKVADLTITSDTPPEQRAFICDQVKQSGINIQFLLLEVGALKWVLS